MIDPESLDDVQVDGGTPCLAAQAFAPPISEVFVQRKTWDELLRSKALIAADKNAPQQAPG